MNKNLFYFIICFLTVSFSAQSQSFKNEHSYTQSKAYALLDLGFSAKLLHLNTEGVNTVVKKEKVKKSPRSLEDILTKSKNKKVDKAANIVNTNKYHLIVGCFSSINNAQRMVSSLNEQGHSSKIIGENKRGLHMVAYNSYASKVEALKDQKDLSSKGVSTWIKTQ